MICGDVVQWHNTRPAPPSYLFVGPPQYNLSAPPWISPLSHHTALSGSYFLFPLTLNGVSISSPTLTASTRLLPFLYLTTLLFIPQLMNGFAYLDEEKAMWGICIPLREWRVLFPPTANSPTRHRQLSYSYEKSLYQCTLLTLTQTHLHYNII